MGQKYLIKQTKNGLITVPLDKYTILGELNGTTIDQVKNIGNSLGVNWENIDINQLFEGTKVEDKEHKDIVGGDTSKAVRIALAHLKEIPDYYTRLKVMESEAESDVKPSFDDDASIPLVHSKVNQMRYEADEVAKGGVGSGRKQEGKQKEEPKGRFMTPHEYILGSLLEARALQSAGRKLGMKPMMGYKPEMRQKLLDIYEKMPQEEREHYHNPVNVGIPFRSKK